jgi:hypothetical protein
VLEVSEDDVEQYGVHAFRLSLPHGTDRRFGV